MKSLPTSKDFSLSISQILWLPRCPHNLDSKHRWEGTSQDIHAFVIIPVEDKAFAFRGQLLHVLCCCPAQTNWTKFEQILSSPMNTLGVLQNKARLPTHTMCSETTQQKSELLLTSYDQALFSETVGCG